MEKSYELKVPGVLDLCWMCSDLCLAATSSGELYTILSPPSQPLTIQNITPISQKLLLSVDFHDTKYAQSDML